MRCDADTPEVEAIGVPAGLDRHVGVRPLVGMPGASPMQEEELAVGQVGSIDPPPASMLVGAALAGQVVGRDRLEDHPTAPAQLGVIPLDDRRDHASLPATEPARRLGRAEGRRAVGVLLDRLPRERTPACS